MNIKEIKAKNIITKSNLPNTDYVINPYLGCSHKCLYCYACFMKRFSNHSESWGDFVDIKINAPDLIPSNTDKYKGKPIFLSSVTDPYLHFEKKYELTRNILKKLIPLQPKLGIQSKSALLSRDIDLFKQFKEIEVGMSISSLNDNIRKEIEPFTSSVKEKLDCLKKLKEAGLKTYVFIGPILPEITDWKKIIEATSEYVDFYYLENLNIKGSIWQAVYSWLLDYHPDLIPLYEEIYSKGNNYWDLMESEIKSFSKANIIDVKICFHHTKRYINT
jgi:DNA repair photolyase